MKGILEIPLLDVYDQTQRFYRNILAFENMHSHTRYFNDYVKIMSYLLITAKDAELLIQNGIVGPGNSERLSTVFHNLNKDSSLTPSFYYSALVEALQNYRRYPYHKWKATLKQNYFNNPWASISAIAVVILLVLTFIQATCSIIAL
ncbi:hypothetical protein OWV82_003229 [Melia azedarach]|uniref:Uncharacterized protein n=1 Tax=Melia azedarach TaxID=155640 RepID=A0ACC1YKL2_MELAZ|nr:hypothetical protein OWV82_003229 [Melia azedarach]